MRTLFIRSVIAVHVLWTFAVLACLPLALLYPASHTLILFFIGFTLVANIPLWMCPLTYLENKLRQSEGYSGTFLHHYTQKFFGIHISESWLKLGQAVYFVGLILLAIFYRLHQAF
ncbi:MAG TPA: DUF2784 family protein [Candidatus Paceibacterota bacterium]|nr:DUF2784 family protein [Candidatus Paceibacterota bacterium]